MSWRAGGGVLARARRYPGLLGVWAATALLLGAPVQAQTVEGVAGTDGTPGSIGQPGTPGSDGGAADADFVDGELVTANAGAGGAGGAGGAADDATPPGSGGAGGAGGDATARATAESLPLPPTRTEAVAIGGAGGSAGPGGAPFDATGAPGSGAAGGSGGDAHAEVSASEPSSRWVRARSTGGRGGDAHGSGGAAGAGGVATGSGEVVASPTATETSGRVDVWVTGGDGGDGYDGADAGDGADAELVNAAQVQEASGPASARGGVSLQQDVIGGDGGAALGTGVGSAGKGGDANSILHPEFGDVDADASISATAGVGGGSEGGVGGAAGSGHAEGSLVADGEVEITIESYGGDGARIDGQRIGAAGGSATVGPVTATSRGGNYTEINAIMAGGTGGDGAEAGGDGADVRIENVIDGSTTGTLGISEEVVGGRGGDGEGPSSRAGAGGDAISISDSAEASEEYWRFVETYGGDAGSAVGPGGVAADGGDASVEMAIENTAGSVIARGLSRAGDGSDGSEGADGGMGGDALYRVHAASKGGGAVIDLDADGGDGGRSGGGDGGNGGRADVSAVVEGELTGSTAMELRADGGDGESGASGGDGGDALVVIDAGAQATTGVDLFARIDGRRGGNGSAASGVGGAGGDAHVDAELRGPGLIIAEFSADGGRGGTSAGGAAGRGGNATGFVDVASEDGGGVFVTMTMQGGAGGSADDTGAGADGASVTLENAIQVDTEGSVFMSQVAWAGNGGFGGGQGGDAVSVLDVALSRSLSIDAGVDAFAARGGGANDSFAAGSDGNATATASIGGVADVQAGATAEGLRADATAVATAGLPLPSLLPALGGPGGDAKANAFADGTSGDAIATASSVGVGAFDLIADARAPVAREVAVQAWALRSGFIDSTPFDRPDVVARIVGARDGLLGSSVLAIDNQQSSTESILLEASSTFRLLGGASFGVDAFALRFVSATAGEQGIGALRFRILWNGGVLLERSFDEESAAAAFFSGDLSLASLLPSSGLDAGDLSFALSVETTLVDAGYDLRLGLVLVPEPGTASLLCLGLLVLARAGRRCQS